MIRKVSILTVVLLLVLAGCSTNLLSERNGPAQERPPGVENGVLTNESALINAHQEEVLDKGFVLARNSSYEYQSEPDEEYHGQVRVEPNIQQYQFTVGGNTTPVTWGNETRFWNYDPSDPPPTYYTTNGTIPLVARGGLGVSFETAGNFTVTTTLQRDGRQLTVLEANGTNLADEELMDSQIRLLVDTEGVVWEQRTITHLQSNTTNINTTVMEKIRLARVGNVSVEEPEWLSEAIRHCTMPNASWSTCEPREDLWWQ